MRHAFVCRQCLSHLRQSSPRPMRLVRAGLHTNATQPPDSVPAKLWTGNHDTGKFQRADRAILLESSGVSEPKEFDAARAAAMEPIRELLVPRYVDRSIYQRLEKGRTLVARIRSTLLAAKKRPAFILPEIMELYGMSNIEARHIVSQLRRLIRGRTRVQAAELLDDFPKWKSGYSLLRQRLSDASTNPESAATPSDGKSWASFADGQSPSIDSIKNAWLQLDQLERQRVWPRIMLSALDENPKVVPALMQATYDSSWSPPYIVEDVIALLLLQADSTTDASKGDLVDLVLFWFHRSPPQHLSLSQHVLFKIVKMASVDQVVELFGFVEHDAEVTSDTRLHFADRLARTVQHKDLAVDIICSLAQTPGFDLNSPAAASVCTTLITLERGSELPPGSAGPEQLFQRLLESGLHPNLLTMTALIRNFCIRGHPEAAWTVFELLIQHGIQPDPHVYSTLLSASKGRQDISSVKNLMAMAHSSGRWDRTSIYDLLDVIYKENQSQHESRRRQLKSQNAFRIMLLLYAKFFHLKPLQKLSCTPLEYHLVYQGPTGSSATPATNLAASLMPLPEARLWKPRTGTLALMLAAYVRRYRKPSTLLGSFDHFHRLFQSNDPLVARLIEEHGSLVFDIYLRGLVQFRHTLNHAVRLLKAMLQSSREDFQHDGSYLRYPAPSIYSWTIMIHGFKNHRQPNLALAMFRKMTQSGKVTPNIVAWNALFGALTSAGDYRRAVKALYDMGRTGLQADARTKQIFARLPLRPRTKAIAYLRLLKKTSQENDLGTEPRHVGDLKQANLDWLHGRGY